MLKTNTAPDALDFSMGDPSMVTDEKLLPALAGLREQAPVYWSELNQCWQLTGYDAVNEAFQDVRFSNVRLSGFAFRSIPEEERDAQIPVLQRGVKDWIVNMDGAPHKRLRSIATRALSKKLVDSMIPQIDAISAELTEKAARLGECDFANEIAYYLPASIILTLVGLSMDHLEKVRDWTRAITSALVAPFSPPELLIACNQAMAEMNDMVRAEIAKRRVEPREDLLTQLVTLKDESSNEMLTEDDILGFCHILLTAGHDTTVNTMVLGLNAFASHPEQVQQFLEGKGDPLVAMQELSRFIGMSTAQARVAGTDFEFHGKQIKKGDVVFLWILSANHDPAKFPDPGKFDLFRPNLSDVMTFGPGLHHCIGHYIARVELAHFFKIFLPRFSKIEILDKPLARTHMLIFRGVSQLRVSFT